MKKNKGTNLLLVGLALVVIGMTMLSNYKIMQYTSMIVGLLIMIYSVFITDKFRKSQKDIKE